MFLYNENDISFDENGIFYGFKKDPSREEKDKFVKAVNQFLKFHAGTKIVSFVVSFRLGNDYKNDVDEWIRSAIGMGAERLTLCLSVQDGEQIVHGYAVSGGGQGIERVDVLLLVARHGWKCQVPKPYVADD
ncbi:hypothetical protein CFP56_033483 [Quercus suber]|uniref:Moybdenum cofactor oxidoreductase dimerisation domain-containing protein n=1 Tax=Quercus suber TaxID=58331 RepID=A0AAW0JEK2_QUESU